MMKTRTEIFEEVKVHLLSQGVRSYAEGACYYRHPQQDLQCAAGCLIPDGMYEPEMEGLSWVDVCRDFDGPSSLGDSYFIMIMQRIHDAVPPAEWANVFKELESVDYTNLSNVELMDLIFNANRDKYSNTVLSS